MLAVTTTCYGTISLIVQCAENMFWLVDIIIVGFTLDQLV